MPYNVIPVGQGKYSVVNTATGKVHAAKTSHAKALRQMRLLYAIEKNPDFKPRAADPDTSSDEDDDSKLGYLDERMREAGKRAGDTKRAMRRQFERRAGVKHSAGWP